MNFNSDKYSELKAQLAALSNAAHHGRDEKADRFRKSYLYFSCLAPTRQGNEISDYVEPVVRKAVETVKPSLMNIFTENEKRAVQFRPLTSSQMDIDMVSSGAGKSVAELVDDFINKTFIQENDGFEILDRALTEVLVTGDVFLKYFVEEVKVEETFTLDKVDETVIQGILEEFPDTDIAKMEKALTKRKGLLTGKMKALRIEKPIRIEFVPFSDIFVTGQHENIKDARYVCQRVSMTVGEAMELGYDFDKLESASNQHQQSGAGFLSTQNLVNMGTFGDDDGLHVLTVDPLERNIYIYEHYLYSSLVDKSKRKSKLYRVVSTDMEILEVEEVSRIPFVHGKMESIPGSFWGRSMYDKLGPIQDIISRLVRSAEFNAADGAYGRYVGVKGMYDKASLLNNRPGSVIEVNPEAGAAAVTRFQKEDLPPSVDALIQRLTQSYKEDAMSFVGVDVSGSGISATAAAITANSADLKDKVIARTLSYTLFRPLFEGIYDIIVSEDLVIGEIPNPQVAEAQAGVESGELPQEVLMEIPQTLPIRGADLPNVSDFVIDVNTANDDAMLNSQLLNLMTMMAQIPQGLVNVQEIAAQFTGMPVHLVAKFFPIAPQPSEEDMMIEQAQKEMALEQGALSLEMMKGEMTKLAAETFEIEKKVELNVAESEAARLRAEEKSIREFKVLEMKEKELTAELEGNQIQISNYTR